MKKRADDAEVMAFLEAVYPGSSNLVAAAFDEQVVLREATRLILSQLRALRNIHMLARRSLAQTQPDHLARWTHVIRLCEEAGASSETGVLRDDE